VATVRDLVNVTKHAIDYYEELLTLEVLGGVRFPEAVQIAHEAATRKAVAELLKLLEGDTCDL